MTPKEKAIEIAMKFDKYGQTDNAKRCALICVDEILENNYGAILQMIFWKGVKEEINKL
tara:strand:- start:489 stop:665 length:177 start_codon:yes stop_codon:yes gene_type:complete